jgi:hypothetical protein
LSTDGTSTTSSSPFSTSPTLSHQSNAKFVQTSV